MGKLSALMQLFYFKITTVVTCIRLSYKYSDKIQFKGFPYINKHPTASIIIGTKTIINSSNYGYHINMHSKCKLYADTPHSLIKIGAHSRIHGVCIHAQNMIKIGNNCLIAANTQIIDSNGHSLSMDKPHERLVKRDQPKQIIIEDNVWIAANCFILGGTHIGEGAIITANSVIKGPVPAKSIFGGNPGKLIKQYE